MRRTGYSKAFWATLNRPVKQRPCDCPGCSERGDYRAPRSRDRLHDYYWFCLEHVRDYNERWDFLKGLSPEEIEEQIRDASVWERPTWPAGGGPKSERQLHEALKRAFAGNGQDETEPRERHASKPPSEFVGERETLAVLGLEPPVDFKKIKTRYKLLVKKHHPDANGGSKDAETKIKMINQAFTALKGMYENGTKAS